MQAETHGGYRRIRSSAQQLRTLVAAASVKSAAVGIRSFISKVARPESFELRPSDSKAVVLR